MSESPQHVSLFYVVKPGRNWALVPSAWSPPLFRQRRGIPGFPSKLGATPSFSKTGGVLNSSTTNPIRPVSVWLMKPSWPFLGGVSKSWPRTGPSHRRVPHPTKTCLTSLPLSVAGSITDSLSTYTPRALRKLPSTMPETPSNTGCSATSPHRDTTPSVVGISIPSGILTAAEAGAIALLSETGPLALA